MVTFHFLATIFGIIAVFVLMPLNSQILDLIIPLNESRPRKSIYNTQYYVDPQANYNWIFIHHFMISFMLISLLVCGDLIFIACIQHACGIFAAIG